MSKRLTVISYFSRYFLMDFPTGLFPVPEVPVILMIAVSFMVSLISFDQFISEGDRRR